MAEIIIDVKNKPLGRVATEIAVILQGKNAPDYQPNKEGADKVVVKNISDIKVTGKKYEEKIYYRHTGYIGHLREETFRQKFEKNPKSVLEHAVRGMLPKNKLGRRNLKRLIIE